MYNYYRKVHFKIFLRKRKLVEPSYIIRLDDACPTSNLEKWDCIEALLDKYKIKPIVAVIPDNKDKELLARDVFDTQFWSRVHRWVNKGWFIALHGYTHEYSTKKRGIVPLNTYSEFAGVPISIQREKIRKGYNILLENGIKSKIWVAPAHSFDKNTLRVLHDETEIRIISDGLAMYPYNRYGFLWIPQQLWSFQKREQGVWTICLHPDTIKIEEINLLSESILNNFDLFNFNATDLIERYSTRKKTAGDFIFQQRFLFRRKYDYSYLNSIFFPKVSRLLKSLLSRSL
jgi:predicted deacetylase